MRTAVGDVKMPVTPNSSTARASCPRARVVERALEHHRGAAGQERRVHHVAVADDPADVGGRPPDVGRLQPEAPPAHAGDVHLIAAMRVHGQLRLRRRAGRGENQGRLVGLHLDVRRSTGLSPRREKVIPAEDRSCLAFRRAVRSGLTVRASTTTCSTDAPPIFSASSTIGLSATSLPFRYVTSAVKTSARSAGDDAVGERARAEPGEHHRVDRADAARRQHQHDGFGSGRHVDGEAIAACATPSARSAAATRSTSSQQLLRR